MPPRTLLDKYEDGAELSDAEVLVLLGQLSAMHLNAFRLGSSFHAVEVAALAFWHAVRGIAEARGLPMKKSELLARIRSKRRNRKKEAMKRVYLNRLLKLANFLDKLKPHQFNFARWVGEEWEGKQHLCGTTGCALGWAATMPAFRRLGLRLFCNPNSSFPNRDMIIGRVGLANTPSTHFYNGGELLPEYVAVREIFGLNIADFKTLFIPEVDDAGRLPNNTTNQQVAENIRKFVSLQIPE